jgi:hypothetical protein
LALERTLQHVDDPNVRCEAANSPASFDVECTWPLLMDAFVADRQLFELARVVIADADGTAGGWGSPRGGGRSAWMLIAAFMQQGVKIFSHSGMRDIEFEGFGDLLILRGC